MADSSAFPLAILHNALAAGSVEQHAGAASIVLPGNDTLRLADDLLIACVAKDYQRPQCTGTGGVISTYQRGNQYAGLKDAGSVPLIPEMAVQLALRAGVAPFRAPYRLDKDPIYPMEPALLQSILQVNVLAASLAVLAAKPDEYAAEITEQAMRLAVFTANAARADTIDESILQAGTNQAEFKKQTILAKTASVLGELVFTDGMTGYVPEQLLPALMVGIAVRTDQFKGANPEWFCESFTRWKNENQARITWLEKVQEKHQQEINDTPPIAQVLETEIASRRKMDEALAGWYQELMAASSVALPGAVARLRNAEKGSQGLY